MGTHLCYFYGTLSLSFFLYFCMTLLCLSRFQFSHFIIPSALHLLGKGTGAQLFWVGVQVIPLTHHRPSKDPLGKYVSHAPIQYGVVTLG